MLNFGLDPVSTITGSLPSCALPGLSGGVDFELENSPCALGAEATLLNFRASSSLPAVTAFSFVGLPPLTWTFGVSGGEGGTLPSL